MHNRFCALGLALTALAAPPVFSATLTVDANCNLIDAILAANTDLAVADCPAGSGPDVLRLTGDVTPSAAVATGSGTPEITSEITLEGAGFRIDRAADPATPEFRLLTVASSGLLRLRHLTVGGGSGGIGGGILNGGALHLEHSSVVENEATFGGGIFNLASATLTVHGSTISDNTSDLEGGGIYNSGQALVTQSTIAGNVSVNDFTSIGGGGIFNNSVMEISESTISGNSAASGGGVHNFFSAALTLTNVTVSGNEDFGFRVGAAGGGGIINNGLLTATHVSIVGNHARTEGGGLFNRRTVVLTNSLIALNTNQIGFRPNCVNFGQPFVLRGQNFTDEPFSCSGFALLAAGLDLDPVLADNGGPTRTHALVPGSVAVDVSPACAPERDQRGALRDALCDSGAFELDDCSFEVDPMADFGGVIVGQSAQVEIELRNLGTTACSVFELAVLGDGFFLAAPSPALPFTVAGGGSIGVGVAFSPTNDGAAAGQLTILSFEDPPRQVMLSGTGLTDSDGDGIPDGDDDCADTDLSDTVPVGTCDSGVDNELLPNGCTIADLIDEILSRCAAESSNRGQLTSCVAHETNELKKQGLITGSDRGSIQSCLNELP